MVRKAIIELEENYYNELWDILTNMMNTNGFEDLLTSMENASFEDIEESA
jgi:hypothetical protein